MANVVFVVRIGVGRVTRHVRSHVTAGDTSSSVDVLVDVGLPAASAAIGDIPSSVFTGILVIGGAVENLLFGESDECFAIVEAFQT